MKKCASCTKDLPDAALHCVFCGAKQPPAPATQGSLAKTAFGSYSANDVLEQMKAQQPAGGYQAPRPAPAPAYNPQAAPPAYAPNAAAYQAAPPMPGRGPNQVPAASSMAPTMMVAPGGGPPPSNFGQQPAAPMGGGPSYQVPPPMAPLQVPPPMAPLMMPTPAAPLPPQIAAPVAPIPAAAPPYLASQTAARAGRPIEPWKDSLRLMMFIWGGALLAAFATPLSLDPLAFHWDAIIDGEGTQKLPPLIMAAVGVLSIVLGFVPTSPAPRGLIAGVLGLAGVVIPMVLGGMPPWQLLVMVGGMIVLIPALLLRQEYRDALLPRLLVTVGVIGSLLVFLLPVDGRLPLVELVKAVIDAPGAMKVFLLLVLGQITIVVLSLLAWLPSPASGGANVFAWLLILWPAVAAITTLVVRGVIGDVLTKTPYGVVAWVAGGGGGGGANAQMIPSIGLGAAYAVFLGYGFATVLGKKLE